jgi:hypothetical protein
MALSAVEVFAACWYCVFIPGLPGLHCHILTKRGTGNTVCNDTNYTCRLYRPRCYVKMDPPSGGGGDSHETIGPFYPGIWY